MEASRPPSSDVAHYLGAVRRHWWIALVATAAGLGVGAAVTHSLPRVYESSSSVLVQSVDQDVNAQGGRTKGAVNLDTEAQLVGSGAVAAKAAALMRTTVSPLELAHSVSVQVPANTTVLVITFQADTPMKAQAGSHAFAEAYLRNREETARGLLDKQIASLNLKVKQLTTALTGINAKLADARPGSSAESNLQSLRSNSQNQLNSLTGRLNELTTTTVGAGAIISDARLPDTPSSPNTLLDIATGGMIGLLLGLALAYLRERFDRRLVTAADVRDRGRVAVLATLDERTTPHFDDVLQPYGPGGRVFNRLRNEVLASLDPHDRVIVVTGTSRGSASTLVAANLAAALARTGSDVVLIGAHLPDSVVDAAPLARMLGVAPVPGLSEMLAGRVSLSRVLQHTARIPALRVITTGGAATAAGLIQSQRLRDTLEALRRQGGYVVIEAPSTSSSADAQSLASLADAAILAVELRRTRRPALVDATEQLQRVGTRLLGAVVLPRLNVKHTAEPAAAPAVTLPPTGTEPVVEEATQQLSALKDRGEPVSATVRQRPADGDTGEQTSVVEGSGATDGDEK
ncbi:lipopolysaccharide biosynthesis protein [Actinoplanes sp. SE50]|uniref:Wzz/FepE/Etk N-terminal domain-containing protein n=1 Tax=unclassified Actinoplanes TaxID=2626549 RepID=UPI00023EBE81|nr:MULTISPECIES: Wzz/FepE/Etk N-terminal domain-containing protein [unclassified Actinoplanes]AEV81811.1 lipopolysaccharide biosynthesis protein [Actinoplanes sp. SE50/110]ATO80212.1 lipopolysaccharide biosynthesis protein [Actinoplanes sp. SE50]SLL97616.1 LPS biosynthesis protein [Actinoplanes sp. SE50/110]